MGMVTQVDQRGKPACALTFAQPGGDVEGHFQSLLSIEARVAVSVVAGAQVSFIYASTSSNTLCTQEAMNDTLFHGIAHANAGPH